MLDCILFRYAWLEVYHETADCTLTAFLADLTQTNIYTSTLLKTDQPAFSNIDTQRANRQFHALAPIPSDGNVERLTTAIFVCPSLVPCRKSCRIDGETLDLQS